MPIGGLRDANPPYAVIAFRNSIQAGHLVAEP
jgi:hypothetical protein